MDGVFACPKCGYELKSKGHTAGRHLRCDWCEAWVEVPFIPRAARPAQRRRRRRMPIWLFWTWCGVGAFAAILFVVLTVRWVQSRANLIQERRVGGLLASAEDNEKAGRLGDAVAELEAALALLRTYESSSSPRLMELYTRRDALVRREVRAQLEALTSAKPDDVVGQCLTLLARRSEQPALAEFEDAIEERLQTAALQSVSENLTAGRADFDAGRSAEALRRCEHIARIVEHAEAHSRRKLNAEARALVTQIAERGGVVIEPVTGQFTFGSPSSYTTSLQPLLADALNQHGYLSCPEGSPWRSVWETAAPFRVAVVMDEQLRENYLQSRNRVSLLAASVMLRQKDTTVWEQLATARTQVPIPKMPAYQAARLGFGDAPVPEYERILYNNARGSFLERFGGSLKNLPDRAKFPAQVSSETPSSGAGSFSSDQSQRMSGPVQIATPARGN